MLLATYYLYQVAMHNCLQRTEERYTERGMEQESSSFIRIFNWKKDKIHLSYEDNFESWEMYHSGDNEVIKSSIFTVCVARY